MERMGARLDGVAGKAVTQMSDTESLEVTMRRLIDEGPVHYQTLIMAMAQEIDRRFAALERKGDNREINRQFDEFCGR